ncbi:MAG TPA: TIGR04222 domain-containing membrane protein, partial [Micromonosporaceae bacterium]|nr:TIGR04222 domain-containing membrane protein [Micromonosporaceae bacterium]
MDTGSFGVLLAHPWSRRPPAAAPSRRSAEIAYSVAGHRIRTRTGLAVLHARGLLTGHAGTLSRTGSPPPASESVERALFSALYGRKGPRELASHRRVRRAPTDLRRTLTGRGLVRSPWRRIMVPAVLVMVPPMIVARLAARDGIDVRIGLGLVMVFTLTACWFLPRRTIAGARTLRALRSAHQHLLAQGDDGHDGHSGGHRVPVLTAEQVGLAVALTGTRALLTTMAGFARDAGLLDGGRWSRYHGDAPLSVTTYTG